MCGERGRLAGLCHPLGAVEAGTCVDKTQKGTRRGLRRPRLPETPGDPLAAAAQWGGVPSEGGVPSGAAPSFSKKGPRGAAGAPSAAPVAVVTHDKEDFYKRLAKEIGREPPAW